MENFIEDITDNINYMFEYNSSEFEWCESHFQYMNNSYIVEYWNTITSLFFTLVGFYGIMRSEKRANKFYGMLATIGLFSAYFHATLSFSGQLLDEIGISLIMIFANYELYQHDHLGIRVINFFALVQLIVQFTFSTYNRFVLFVYALLFVNKFWLALRSHNKKIRWFSHISIGLFTMSVMCWFLDFYACVRNSPFNFHGMWHIFIALTAYFTIETCLSYYISANKVQTAEFREDWTTYYEN